MTTTQKDYQNIKIKKLADSRVSIEGEVTAEAFAESYQETVETLRKDFEAPGFRKGHVPENIFIERVNKGHLLEEAAETALRRVYPQIIADHELKPLAIPQISITKLAPNNPMGFKAEVAVRPEVKLPDYKKIGKKAFANDIPPELKEEEVEVFIKQLLDMENQIRSRAGNEEAQIPAELTDEFVKKLGPFEGVEDFKKKIREDMLAQRKSERAREKRENFAKELIEASTIVLPPEVIEEEFDASFNRILEDLKEANLSLEDYVKKLNKTEEQFKKEKREQIENQTKLRFLLEDIAEAEKINPPEDEVMAEVARLKKAHPNAHDDQIRSYVELAMRNEAVLKSLENQPDTTV